MKTPVTWQMKCTCHRSYITKTKQRACKCVYCFGLGARTLQLRLQLSCAGRSSNTRSLNGHREENLRGGSKPSRWMHALGGSG